MPSDFRFSQAVLQAATLVTAAVGIVLLLQLRSDVPPLLGSLETTGTSTEQVISIEEAKARIQSGNAIFIDARDALDYMDSHLPGAASLPFKSDQDNERPLQVIVYCSDPSCGKAETLAAQMASQGFEIFVLPEGAAGWAKAGEPMEMSQ